MQIFFYTYTINKKYSKCLIKFKNKKIDTLIKTNNYSYY